MAGDTLQRRAWDDDNTQDNWHRCVRARCRSLVVLLLVMSWGLFPVGIGAAERDRPLRIGALTDSWGATPTIAGLRDGLAALGYREYDDFVIGVRFTQGDHSQLPAAARGLVEYGVDLIFVTSTEPAKAAQQATTRIPIVFAWVEDPVGLDLVQSFARPGGNITGVATLTIELAPKRLEVFKELIPGLKRVLFPYDPIHTPSVAMAQAYRAAAHHLGIELIAKPVRTEEEAQALLARVGEIEADGILQPPSLSLNIPGFIAEATLQQATPTMFDSLPFVEVGGLASYGIGTYESGLQAARLVDKIFKGAAPADIPVEVNSKIELVINLKVAKSLELAIPPTMLYQATKVIR